MAGSNIWGTPEAEQQRLRDEHTALAEEISRLGSNITHLNGALAPARAREDAIKAALGRTYGRNADGSRKLNFDGVEARKPLFEELMVLAEEWGHLKAARSQMVTLRKACERELEQIEKTLKSAQRRKQRKPHGNEA